MSLVKAVTIATNSALKMRALREMEDQSGQMRVAGEEWLVSKQGNYMPGPYEEIVETLQGSVLTASKSIHLRAKANFTDFLNKERKTGEEWLVTKDDIEQLIPGVNEEIIR